MLFEGWTGGGGWGAGGWRRPLLPTPPPRATAATIRVCSARGGLIGWQPRLLIRHFQEQQKRQLLHVIGIRQTVIPEDGTVIPELLNQLLRIAHGTMIPVIGWSTTTSTHAVPLNGRKALPSVESNCSPVTRAAAAIHTSV